jgi:hypothetical protein
MANLSNINNKFIVADVATATRVSIGITTTNNLLTLFGTGAGKWSARKAQALAKAYKKAGGGYK